MHTDYSRAVDRQTVRRTRAVHATVSPATGGTGVRFSSAISATKSSGSGRHIAVL